MSIDPRLLERRKAVAEDNAQKNVGRLLRFLGVLLLVGSLVWLAFSPWLSVSQVRTAGIVSSGANAILAEHRVVAGTPMISLRPGSVEDALETDPWIRQARVHLSWPNEVLVQVQERVPVLWVESGAGWSRRAVDGISLPGRDRPDSDSVRLLLPEHDGVDLEHSPVVQGAAEFVATLSPEVKAGLVLRLRGGELWADVDGFDVRLGRPIEMTAKARSLTALLAEDLPENAVLILVAPSHPAVDTGVEPEPSDEVDAAGEGSDTETGSAAEEETSEEQG